MSFNYINTTPDEIRNEIPLPDSLQTIQQKEPEITDVLTGKSKRFLVIIDCALLV